VKRVTLRLGPAQVFYVQRLLKRALSGDTFDEVVMTLFLAGLREYVPAEWMREWVEGLKPKRPKRAKGGHARAAALSAARRTEIAKKSAQRRWHPRKWMSSERLSPQHSPTQPEKS
jgi:hypothetical protein